MLCQHPQGSVDCRLVIEMIRSCHTRRRSRRFYRKYLKTTSKLCTTILCKPGDEYDPYVSNSFAHSPVAICGGLQKYQFYSPMQRNIYRKRS
ncbi:hypothetical protein MPTK1_7g19130 [Marchantia polymorpha subsp. ruderalis]|uniref:Uncharacterized protein n=2 Tax=Marchantia polymorpha TaxID=3197 RepID=A0AAF6C1B5_MARPO|nr:hypothetical protein MARPO_0067s0065 [Marchantia polymorpha]BBN18049.1 hypothetical protein Mp_7g19130 [Marchantia polymorpha subsp. ruderalis]|eukprot:PTQ35986.1 hypothetical protein MARPO_0067s0065 [Marchantia polymorpha]